MANPTQANSNLGIKTELGEDKVLIDGALITEQLGRLFKMDVTLKSGDGNIAFDKIVGTNATIRLEVFNSKTPRYFNGYVNRFVQVDSDPKGGTYRATLVPWLWFLTRTADCRIFQKQSVPDIVKQVFRDHGFTDFKDSLNGHYTPWENCVQYRETDFNFVSRLMEHEGIYYYFEHTNGKHTLVLADSISAHKPFPGYDQIPSMPSKGGTRDKEYISDWVLEQQIQPGSYTLNDFNFEKPKNSLVAKSDKPRDHAQSKFEIYDYPGEYEEHGDGTDYSKVRIEELHAQHELAHAQTDARGLAVGYTFGLTGSSRRDQNKQYLVTSASYRLTGDDYVSGGDGESEFYSCNFTVTSTTQAFRTARTTPKPLIQGPQTAIIVGPKGEEIHTDKYGRVKVQFHWDRYGKADENSSCWVRVAQSSWAGKKWGAFGLPRIGHEVIVEFLEGDPDLPIVTGQVYNADHMPPYDLPTHKTRTTFKTNSSKGGGGFNELRFEDKKSKEQVFIHAERNMDTRVKASKFETVGGQRHLVVGGDQFDKIKGDKHQEVVGEHNVKIGDSLSITAGAAFLVKLGNDFGVDAGLDITLKAANGIAIEAGNEITIKAGGSFITLGPAGVAIKGAMVLINSGGSPVDGFDVDPNPPKPASEADNAVAGSKGDPSATPAVVKPTTPSSVPISPAAAALLQAALAGIPLLQQCSIKPPPDYHPPGVVSPGDAPPEQHPSGVVFPADSSTNTPPAPSSGQPPNNGRH